MGDQKSVEIVLPMQADVPNRNNRVYAREVLKKLAEQIQEKAQNGTLLVYKDPPPGEPPNLLDAVGKVKGSELDDDRIILEIQDLGNSRLAEMIERGVVEVNPVSSGSITTLPDGTQVVEDAEFSHLTLNKPPPKPES